MRTARYIYAGLGVLQMPEKYFIRRQNSLCRLLTFIPASNEQELCSLVWALAHIFGECRGGQMPRQLAAGYLIGMNGHKGNSGIYGS